MIAYRTPSYIRYRVIDNEAILVNQKAGEVLGLDEIGTRVFELIREHGALEAVIDALHKEFAIDRESLENEVKGFVDELCSAGLVERFEDTP